MSTLPEGITQADLDRYLRLDEGIKKLEAEKASLNALVKTSFPSVGTFVFGDVIVDRSDSMGLDVKAVASEFPYDTNPEYYTPTVDRTKVPEIVKAEHFTLTQRLSVKRVAK